MQQGISQITKARIPSKARKLAFRNQIWHWLVGGIWGSEVIIWSPECKKHIVPKYKILGLDKPPSDWYDLPDRAQVVYPGNVRKYIEEKIIGGTPEFAKDTTAVAGKIYVYKHRDKTRDQAPVVSIDKIEPTGLKRLKSSWITLIQENLYF